MCHICHTALDIRDEHFKNVVFLKVKVWIAFVLLLEDSVGFMIIDLDLYSFFSIMLLLFCSTEQSTNDHCLGLTFNSRLIITPEPTALYYDGKLFAWRESLVNEMKLQ